MVPWAFRQAPAKPQTSDDIAAWSQDRGILKEHIALAFLDPRLPGCVALGRFLLAEEN